MRFVLFLLLTIVLSTPALAQRAVTSKHEQNLELWLPPDFQSGKGPWPLILFSHGFGGCAKQSAFLTAYIAEQGYIVAAPDHEDARTCKSVRAYEMQKDMLERMPEVPFRQPEQWSDETYTSRRDDMKTALSSILADPLFKGYVDEDRIGLMGHSLGGYTALGIAGAWQSWKDDRIKAIMLLAPYTAPYVVEKTIRNIDVPVMYITGSRDQDITAVITKPGAGAYALSKAPKHYLEIEAAGHFSFTERDPRFHDILSRKTLAFFDRYLKDQDALIHSGKEKNVREYKEDVKTDGR